MQDKETLRTALRQRRRALAEGEQQSAAEAVAAHVAQLPGWHSARKVALYMAADGELDPTPIAARARREEKTVFLPVITADRRLQFHPWQEGAPLTTNHYGIPEPTGTDPVAIQTLDYIFLPLVGWDERGGRLGMGGGFYDRSLAGVEGVAFVGLAHECQRVPAIPVERWDVRLHFVATGLALHTCLDTP